MSNLSRAAVKGHHWAIAPRTYSVDALRPRWRGQSGRLEVWYATVSDPGSGCGLWVHVELVAPTGGGAYVHGWAAVFRRAAEPVLERFGPIPPPRPMPRGAPSPGGFTFLPSELAGNAGRIEWDLRSDETGSDTSSNSHAGSESKFGSDASVVRLPQSGDGPLFTFPAWAWEREVLPAAQIVPVPSASFTGTLRVQDEEFLLSSEARGNIAHIYGHGNAQRWGWLHAELGEGRVLEIVSAVSRRPGLRYLKPLAFVQLRTAGRDWPRDPLAAAALFHTELGLPDWSLSGTIGRHRLRAEITIPPERAVSVQYVDPDGATATCTNSEQSDARILLERRTSHWETVSSWTLKGSAHSEVGTRP